MKLLAISGSARSASTNTALLQVLAEVSPKNVDITVFHKLQTLPVFSPDLEGTNTPSEVIGFIYAIDQADGVIISSPEYVRAIPGGLKNAIDWLVSGETIIDKPVALIHGSHRGDDMLASLRLVLGTVTPAFHKQIFQRFPLISKSPKEVRSFLSQKEHTERLLSYITEFSSAILGIPKRHRGIELEIPSQCLNNPTCRFTIPIRILGIGHGLIGFLIFK